MARTERTRKFCFFLEYLCLYVVLSVCHGQDEEPVLYGYKVDDYGSFEYEADGQMFVYSEQDVEVRFLGPGFVVGQMVAFTLNPGSRSDNCDDMSRSDAFEVSALDGNMTSALLTVNLKNPEPEDYFVCIKGVDDTDSWLHQGTESWLTFRFKLKPGKQTILPLWLQIIIIIVLLAFSGLFSGLNLGLMSLDQTELKILTNCGSPRERTYAKRIAPLRKRGNLLLCTILLGNVLVNNTLTILLDDLTGSGYAAILGATGGIVVFGEIIPQAVCSRYGLAIGANTIWFTIIFVILTFPLSYPISKLLDLVLGEEIGAVYNRDRLRELLRLTQEKTDLINDEVNIITGALELSKKTVADIMTRLEDVYMIESSSILDFDTMNDIMKTGYTRVPVYEGEKVNIVHILNIKDLAFIDPDDKTPLKQVCDFFKHPIQHVFDDMKLSQALHEFKEGKSHMAFVRRVVSDGPGDPYYETIGVVTLEDVIEEIIQSEILDETDTVTDNRKKKQRVAQVRDYSIFNQPDELQQANYPKISAQLALATFQYLSTTVPAFKPELVSENVLQRIIKQNVVFELHKKNRNLAECTLYRSGRKCDYFILILQGRVEVDVGRDNMTFEAGPFTYFGMHALTGVVGSASLDRSMTSLTSAGTGDLLHTAGTKPAVYVPDFTVHAVSDFLQYLKIRRNYYEAARRATAMELSHRATSADTGAQEDHFSKEWMKVKNAPQHDDLSIRTVEPDPGGVTPTTPVSVVIDNSGELRQRSITQNSSTGSAYQEPSSATPPPAYHDAALILNQSASSDDAALEMAGDQVPLTAEVNHRDNVC